MERAGSVLSSLVKDLGIEAGLELYRIRTNWGKTFQEPLSLHSYPSGFSEGILQVNVDSPVWLQQLNFHKRELLKKLDIYGVKDIRFKLGRVSPNKRARPSKETTLSLSDEDRSFIDDVVTRLDDELGSSIRNAMESWALKERGA